MQSVTVIWVLTLKHSWRRQLDHDYITVPLCTVQYNIALYCTILYSTTLYCTIQYSTIVEYSTALQCMKLKCKTVLQCLLSSTSQPIYALVQRFLPEDKKFGFSWGHFLFSGLNEVHWRKRISIRGLMLAPEQWQQLARSDHRGHLYSRRRWCRHPSGVRLPLDIDEVSS